MEEPFMENKSLQVTIRLKSEIKRQLRVAAAEQDTNMSVLAEHLVETGLEEYRKRCQQSKPPKQTA
jgi:predicted transcriptional regulator